MEQNNTANAKLRYTTPSDVISSVTEEIKNREILGLKKYGTTVDREDLTEDQWLQHAYEEALDLAVYLKKIIMTRKKAIAINYLSPDDVEAIDQSHVKIEEQ